MKYAKMSTLPRMDDPLLNRALQGLDQELKKIARVLNMSDFKGLADTPSSYSDQAGKGLKVKATEDRLEFYSITDADELVKVDSGATAGYIGAAFNDGVLRASAPLSYADGGDFITLGVDGTVLVDGNFDSAGLMKTDGAGTYSVVTDTLHTQNTDTALGSGAVAVDHGTAATDQIINACYGTGDPPAANTTTIGSLFIKYTA